MHDAILTKLEEELTADLITDPTVADPEDPAIAGAVKIGPLQGEPEPDDAKISVTIHENDPDAFYSGALTGLSGTWEDEVLETEVGGALTYARRFSVQARCLLEGNALTEARDIASTVRARIEYCLRHVSWTGVTGPNNEIVTRGIYDPIGEMIQGGGPPTSYDFHIKVRFEIWTTTTGV